MRSLMNTLDRYIGQTLFSAMLIASLGLVGFLAIFTFLDQLEDIKKDYTIIMALYYVAYSLPRLFYESVPYAILIGSLAGLGQLASKSEIIVMQTAGFSLWQISRGVIYPALLFVLTGMLVGEFLLPELEQKGRILREEATEVDLSRGTGFWHREDDTYMHFTVSQSNRLTDITLYTISEERQLVQSLWAGSAHYIEPASSPGYWLLKNVWNTEIAEAINDANVNEQIWSTSLTPAFLGTALLVEPANMSIRALREKITSMGSQGLNTSRFELGFWTKIMQPVLSLGLVFIAISFIFGPLRESTFSLRIVSGLFVSILFKFTLDLLSPACLVFGFSPILATVLPVAGCLAVGTYLLKRAG
jgi:lipopolysaccharide export system permease protein